MPGLRTILVPFNNAQPTAPAVKAAKKLAEAEGAYIEGAYCRQVLPIIAGEGITLPGDYLAEFEEEGRHQAALARTHFESLAAEMGIPMSDLAGQGLRAGWTEMMGTGPEGIGEYARAFGISVLHRDIQSSSMDWKSTAEALLFESGRPLLLVSNDIPDTIGRRILVAWNGSIETARALSAARPLLASCEALQVLSVQGGMTSGPDVDLITAHLKASGFRAESNSRDSAGTTVGQVIVDEASAFGADLIIKGAFTHSRLRQLVFGGATSEIFNHASCPVILCH
ncbi:MAG: universal stress protein [Arenicellales bacterium]|jgi:nucleotide-binding universal stress UspA family protein